MALLQVPDGRFIASGNVFQCINKLEVSQIKQRRKWRCVVSEAPDLQRSRGTPGDFLEFFACDHGGGNAGSLRKWTGSRICRGLHDRVLETRAA
ncbi:hypothetical protein TNCV_2068971 [Trichonephila clavipes]|uniref:Uncharacterized protein n=1 Tax=Trichonephila clavipes TaxID=2585209 RepID=A0A8X6W2U8_TRICX|nr:hypothetical protein TNCV_2068971 [Trichonephila clavipes]